MNRTETTNRFPETRSERFRLFRRREIIVPTWRGWLLILGVLAGLVFGLVKTAHQFLAISNPLPSRILVLEGWAPDYAARKTVEIFRAGNYDKLFVTGGPIESGAPLSEYRTYAELGTAVVMKLGFTSNEVQVVPAPLVRQDRTYTSAVVLRRWWKEHGVQPGGINLVTVGPHARRSRLLFEKALGNDWQVGVISVTSEAYDPEHWWRTSSGVRTVTGEVFAYLYARLLFRPARADREIEQVISRSR